MRPAGRLARADHHDGYICWPEFERNQQLLANNRTNAEHMPLSGAAREGLALLHPSNRLVAATLEQRWNDALVRLEEIRTQFADFQSKEAIVVTPEQRARVAALAQDFPRLWNAPTTKAKDKKRILRLLIKDITVERFGERKTAVLHVRWQGGACEDLVLRHD